MEDFYHNVNCKYFLKFVVFGLDLARYHLIHVVIFIDTFSHDLRVYVVEHLFSHTHRDNNCFLFPQELLCSSLLLFKSLIDLEFTLM